MPAVNAFGDPVVEQPRATGVNAFGDPIVGGTAPSSRQAQSLADAFTAGFQSNSGGLLLRGKLPDVELAPDASMAQRLSSALGGVVSDIPAMVVGIPAGAAAGTAAGGPIGGLVGAGAGGLGAPMALREALIEAYQNNHAASWQGVVDIAMAALKGGAKGSLIGGLTGGAGALAGRAVGNVLAPAVGQTITGQAASRVAGTAVLGTELTTMVTASAALEGHMPTAQDFIDNAVLLGGLKAAGPISKKMMNIFRETGRRPEQVVVDAQRDPALKAELAKEPARGEPLAPEIPAAYAPLALAERVKAAVDRDPNPEFTRQILNGEPAGKEPARAPVAWEYVTDAETAREVIRAVTSRDVAEVERQRRGVVPDAQSVADAQALLDAGGVGKREVGAAANNAETLVRAAYLRDAARHAAQEIEAVRQIPEAARSPVDQLRVQAALELVSVANAELAGARAEAGRALRMYRLLKQDPNMLGEANMLLAAADRKLPLNELLKLVQSLKDNPDGLVRFAEGYQKATTFEKVLEVWKAGILSGPQTHLANIFGNLTKYAVEIPESALAATIFAVNRAAKGDPIKTAQWKARAFAPLYGIKFGAADALKVAAEVWSGKGESLEKADVYKTAVEGKVGDFVRLPFRALQTEDAFFRTFSERAEAHRMAVDRAVKEGLHPDTAEFRQAVVQYTQRPEFGLSDKAGEAALKQIQEAGAEGVFAQRLGPFLETLQGAIARHAPAMQFVLPFVRTPANLVSWAVQHVPGLNLMSGRWREDYAAGGERQARAVARVMIGAGITGTAVALAQSGILTGGGMFDKEQGNAKRAAGWQPYSLRIGDTYYSYQRIEPVAKVMGLAADLIELGQKAEDEQDKAKIAALTVLLFSNATISTTYLSGLSNVIQAATDPARKGEPLMEQYASSLVPKIIGQTVTMADPYKREVDGVIDAIQSQLPGLREKLLPKRDVWGEKAPNERWLNVMPVASTQESKDKVKTEAVRLQLAIADVPQFVTEKGPFKPSEKRLELTGAQRDLMREVGGKEAMGILSGIVNSPDWKTIPDFAQAAIYRKVISDSKTRAAFAALPPDDAARVAMRQKIVDEVIRQTQEAQSR